MVVLGRRIVVEDGFWLEGSICAVVVKARMCVLWRWCRCAGDAL